jgi:hypothetical protein
LFLFSFKDKRTVVDMLVNGLLMPTGNTGTALNTATESVNNQVFGNASNYSSAMTSLSPEVFSTNKRMPPLPS